MERSSSMTLQKPIASGPGKRMKRLFNIFDSTSKLPI
jgi:hypothetical protein